MTDSIGSRIRSGVAWKAGSQVTLQVSRMVVALILARLLAPEDWGLAAMVLVFSGFAVVFTDSALGTALIQRRTIVEADRSTVFWTNAGIGLALMLVGIGLSDPLARFYGEAEVAPLLAVLSV
jgi:O-antigen/teichoic acid export membrane protein